MMMIISCTQCSSEGMFKVEFIATPEVKTCTSCYHSDTKEWKFYFCDMNCFSKWLEENKILTEGVPCQDCRQTGFSYGYQENGICKTCNGSKKVKLVGTTNKPRTPLELKPCYGHVNVDTTKDEVPSKNCTVDTK